MTTDAARKAVFNTNELLELILVFLPPKSLFGVQRVSKQFQAIIATSVPIQEKMFLRLRNTPEQGWVRQEKMTADGKELYFVEGTDPSSQQALRIPTQLNPFLRLRDKSWHCVKRTTESAILDVENPITLATLDHRAPSILKTYISDPPSDSVEVFLDYQLPQGEIETSRMMRHGERGDGTIGDSIRNTLEGYDRVMIKWYGPGRNPNLEERTDGRLANSRQVIERFENASAPSGKRKGGGLKNLEFVIYDMIVPTEAERAAVKKRGVSDSSNPANEK